MGLTKRHWELYFPRDSKKKKKKRRFEEETQLSLILLELFICKLALTYTTTTCNIKFHSLAMYFWTSRSTLHFDSLSDILDKGSVLVLCHERLIPWICLCSWLFFKYWDTSDNFLYSNFWIACWFCVNQEPWKNENAITLLCHSLEMCIYLSKVKRLNKRENSLPPDRKRTCLACSVPKRKRRLYELYIKETLDLEFGYFRETLFCAYANLTYHSSYKRCLTRRQSSMTVIANRSFCL